MTLQLIVHHKSIFFSFFSFRSCFARHPEIFFILPLEKIQDSIYLRKFYFQKWMIELAFTAPHMNNDFKFKDPWATAKLGFCFSI